MPETGNRDKDAACKASGVDLTEGLGEKIA
jgi:hypothetical protein